MNSFFVCDYSCETLFPLTREKCAKSRLDLHLNQTVTLPLSDLK